MSVYAKAKTTATSKRAPVTLQLSAELNINLLYIAIFCIANEKSKDAIRSMPRVDAYPRIAADRTEFFRCCLRVL